MYSRKTSGYIQPSPPPNYNGVAFTRGYHPYSEIRRSEKPDDSNDESAAAPALPGNIPGGAQEYARDGNYPPEEEVSEGEIGVPGTESDTAGEGSGGSSEPPDKEPLAEDPPREKPEIKPSEEEKPDILSLIATKEFRLEDLMLIGAVLLFVSGELDGDILLLLGLLLISGAV